MKQETGGTEIDTHEKAGQEDLLHTKIAGKASCFGLDTVTWALTLMTVTAYLDWFLFSVGHFSLLSYSFTKPPDAETHAAPS